MKNQMIAVFLLFSLYANAQVKIGDNSNTINTNSLLELESTNKGFLPPRIALNSISSVSPLTGTVTAGMLVYSTGGSLTDGYYYWNGTEWRRIGNGETHLVSKSASATLTKTETFVLASNDITLTLPTVISADDGNEITIKNVGTYTDLITIQGNGGATIDGSSTATLSRWRGQTFVANGGNWVLKNKNLSHDNILDVNVNSSWTTLDEAIAFLDLHMTGSTVVRLDEETYDISSTISINLPYTLTFEGASYGTSTVAAASGLANKPMFRCLSACFFKMLTFDATTLTNYGTLAGEDAIRLLGSGTYNEIKDCSFDRFYNTILDSTDAELWLFETDISNAQHNGVLIHGAVTGVTVKIAETDFISCARGVNLDKATSATIQLASGGYYNANSTDTAIIYNSSTFTSFTSISIKGNLWNNTGKYIEGFDFTRSDGRDANAIVESNAGMGDKNPNCNINVLNNATTTSTTATGTWYKANWTNTSSTTTKWTISNNKITYQPNNRRNGWIIISGNLSSSSSSSTINVGIVKNGSSGTRYGETTLKTTAANVPFQFSTVVYLADIAPGDYFELWVNSNVASSTVTIQDVLWLVNTQ
jgi:hypothetical protein